MPPHHPNGYMQYQSIQNYYNRLTNPNSPEDNVAGHLWYNILREYFLVPHGFGLEVQPHPTPGVTNQSDDAHIRCVKNGSKTPLSLIEMNPASVTLEQPDAAWKEGHRQLTEFMTFASMDSTDEMVGIVNIGRYSRFYVLRLGQQTFDEHHATGSALLEFKENETQIVDLLLTIRAGATEPSSACSLGDTNA